MSPTRTGDRRAARVSRRGFISTVVAAAHNGAPVLERAPTAALDTPSTSAGINGAPATRAARAPARRGHGRAAP